ncbi:hypothetical protein D9756_009284 [Leucocoprinus leucothites]|uniref:DUF300-domain-containing protein n=1 Tax=Leucocoprinus leucothites TaxID=201217 RepID=A0A8H5CYH8_9AGAR|nr:hypothetical protein D9756_009284 [Leucoagaricus leucothites]
MSCPVENQVIVDQSKFWDSNGIHWTTHRIGWAIAGGCAVITVIISAISIFSHCRNYTNPPQQRQMYAFYAPVPLEHRKLHITSFRLWPPWAVCHANGILLPASAHLEPGCMPALSSEIRYSSVHTTFHVLTTHPLHASGIRRHLIRFVSFLPRLHILLTYSNRLRGKSLLLHSTLYLLPSMLISVIATCFPCALQAIGLSAFLLLLIEYVAATAIGKSAERALERKDKTPLPLPFCCWRYRPTKAYFMYTVKWSVLQYVIIRPAASVAGIICEKYEVLCAQAGFSPRWANAYIECINFISISIALYGLLVFYGLTSDELRDRRPMAKFLSIKLIVMFTFYQSFVFSALESRKIIQETAYWTTTNVTDGLNALAICIEMVFFSLLMLWAYSAKEYKREGSPTSIWKPLWDSINYSDFAAEIASSFKYYWGAARHNPKKQRRHTMVQVFGADGRRSSVSGPGFSSTTPVLRSISPAPSPSLPPDEVHIPLTTMNSPGYKSSSNFKKDMGGYSPELGRAV